MVDFAQQRLLFRQHRAEPFFGLIRADGETADQVSFVKPLPEYEIPGTYLRVTEMLALRSAPGLAPVATLTPPALRVTETEWVTHNVIPGRDTARPAMAIGNAGKGVFIYSAFRYFKESRESGLASYRILLERALASYFRPALRVVAPRAVDAIYNRTVEDVRIILINSVTNRPAGEGNRVQIDEIVPVSGISIQTRYREARDGRGARLRVRRDGSHYRVLLPPLETYQVVYLR